jgi:hypothetical protein
MNPEAQPEIKRERELFFEKYDEILRRIRERVAKLQNLGIPAEAQRIYRTFYHFIETGFQEGYTPEDYLEIMTQNIWENYLQQLTEEDKKNEVRQILNEFFKEVSKALIRKKINNEKIKSEDVQTIVEDFKSKHSTYEEFFNKLGEEINRLLEDLNALYQDQENIFIDYLRELGERGLIDGIDRNIINANAEALRKFILKKRYEIEITELPISFDVSENIEEIENTLYLLSLVSVSPDEIPEDKREQYLSELSRLLSEDIGSLVGLSSSSVGIPVTPKDISPKTRLTMVMQKDQPALIIYDFGELEEMTLTPSVDFIGKVAESLKQLIGEIKEIKPENADRILRNLEENLDHIITFIEREITPPTEEEILKWFELRQKKKNGIKLTPQEKKELRRLYGILRRHLNETEIANLYSDLENAGIGGRSKAVQKWINIIEQKILSKNPEKLKKVLELLKKLKEGKIKEAKEEKEPEKKAEKLKEILSTTSDVLKILGGLILAGGLLWIAFLGFFAPLWLIEKVKKDVKI